jgi:transposase-like protein
MKTADRRSALAKFPPRGRLPAQHAPRLPEAVAEARKPSLTPAEIIFRLAPDGHDAYPRAIRTELGRHVRHRTSRYLNNRLEQDHRGIKPIEATRLRGAQ